MDGIRYKYKQMIEYKVDQIKFSIYICILDDQEKEISSLYDLSIK